MYLLSSGLFCGRINLSGLFWRVYFVLSYFVVAPDVCVRTPADVHMYVRVHYSFSISQRTTRPTDKNVQSINHSSGQQKKSITTVGQSLPSPPFATATKAACAAAVATTAAFMAARDLLMVFERWGSPKIHYKMEEEPSICFSCFIDIALSVVCLECIDEGISMRSLSDPWDSIDKIWCKCSGP